MKAIGIANAVKEGVNQNKENQQILAQATVEANNDKIEQLEKQQAQLLHAVLMTQQPQQSPVYRTQQWQQSKHQQTKSIDLKVEKEDMVATINKEEKATSAMEKMAYE